MDSVLADFIIVNHYPWLTLPRDSSILKACRIKDNDGNIRRPHLSDLEGWSRVIEESNVQDDKETQSKPEIKGKNCSND